MYETTELDHWGPTEWPDWSKWSTLKNVDDQFWTNRTGPFHLTSNRRFRNLGLNGKRPSISMASWIQPVKGCCGCARVDGLKEDLFWSALSLLFYLTFSTRLLSLHERDSSAIRCGSGMQRSTGSKINFDLILYWFYFIFCICLLIQNEKEK